ncbi:hypothetical protein [Aphanothece hegewaldii]|nr:hypothetical protein [Aphanothece hegewaldii]
MDEFSLKKSIHLKMGKQAIAIRPIPHLSKNTFSASTLINSLGKL